MDEEMKSDTLEEPKKGKKKAKEDEEESSKKKKSPQRDIGIDDIPLDGNFSKSSSRFELKAMDTEDVPETVDDRLMDFIYKVNVLSKFPTIREIFNAPFDLHSFLENFSTGTNDVNEKFSEITRDGMKVEREKHLEEQRAAHLAREKIKEALSRKAKGPILEPTQGSPKRPRQEDEEELEHIQADPPPSSPIVPPAPPSSPITPFPPASTPRTPPSPTTLDPPRSPEAQCHELIKTEKKLKEQLKYEDLRFKKGNAFYNTVKNTLTTLLQNLELAAAIVSTSDSAIVNNLTALQEELQIEKLQKQLLVSGFMSQVAQDEAKVKQLEQELAQAKAKLEIQRKQNEALNKEKDAMGSLASTSQISQAETHLHVQLPQMPDMPDLPGTSHHDEEHQGPAPGPWMSRRY
ncbi:hypothetical protein L7F22_037455 [Adiantum nelumboides]|nr:hypothetical protein [Adiantum nelumboides]